MRVPDAMSIDRVVSEREHVFGNVVTVEGIMVYWHGYRVCLVSRELAEDFNSSSFNVDYSRSITLKMPGLGRRLEGSGYVIMGGIGRINWLEVTGRLMPSEVEPFAAKLTDISACTIHCLPESKVEPSVIPVDLSTVGQLSPWEQAEVESPGFTPEERTRWHHEFLRRNQE